MQVPSPSRWKLEILHFPPSSSDLGFPYSLKLRGGSLLILVVLEARADLEEAQEVVQKGEP